MLVLVGAVGAFLEIAYKLVFAAIVVYISGGMNRSNNANGSAVSILEGKLTFGSQ
jgi:hypothetical protein